VARFQGTGADVGINSKKTSNGFLLKRCALDFVEGSSR
jgi:hypothetical protein